MRETGRTNRCWRRIAAVFLSFASLIAAASATESAAGGSAPDQDLAALLEDYRSLALDDVAYPVQGAELKLAHLTLSLQRGQAVPLRSRGGELLGLYFAGSGRYTYESEDPGDRQTLAANLAAATKAKILRDGTISDGLDGLLVFFARPVFEELFTGEGMPLADASIRKGFEKAWGRIEKTYLEYDHLTAQARLNGGDQQYVYMEIDGRDALLGYSLDAVRGYTETLHGFRSISGYDLRFIRWISGQPYDGGPEAHAGPVRLEHANIAVETDDNKTARIKSTLTFRVGTDDLRLVPLLLLNNRDPYAYDWTSDRYQLRVLQVTDAAGHELPFSHRYHEILVKLPEARSAGSSITLNFDTEGEILGGLDASSRANYFQLFNDNWFPRAFGGANNLFTFSLQVKTAKPYRPVASGKIKRFEETDSGYELETESSDKIRFLAVFAGKYKTVEEKFDDLTIRVHGYAMASKRVLKNLPKLANGMIRFYEDTLGPYPYDALDIIEVPDYGFGIAPAGIVLLTSEAYKARQDFLASYFSRGINARLAHEIAHQWFGNQVLPALGEDNWLSESMAEYVSGMAIAALAGNKKNVYNFDRMLIDWRRDALACRDAGPISHASRLGGPDAGRFRRYLLYDRGPLVLRMLHSMIGNDRFYRILKRFLSDFRGKAATTEDFEKTVQKVLGGDVKWFFDQWIREGGVPEIRVSHRIERSGGQTLLTGTAELEEGSVFKRIHIPVVVDYGGQKELRVIDMNQPRTEFSFPIARKPKKVEVDPAHNMLAVFH